MINKTPSPGYKQEPGFGRVSDGKIYVGLVKKNDDAQMMGRLAVWIPEIGGDENDPDKWFIVGYASPFAGSTNHENTIRDSKTMDGTQTSYGWWAVPPDINNLVLVVFLNGEAAKGVWFACLWQQNMNHMVPGVASNTSFQEGLQGIMPPVVEYNKNDTTVDPQNPIRARFDPLHEGLTSQGLYSDFERGPSDSSARRESPSKVFGLSTPRSNSLYIDDDPANEFVRIRTRGGTQVLVHETNGYVYINSKKGNSWIEVSDDGVDIYSKGDVSVRSEQNFNVRADKNINLDAGGKVNITAGETINAQSGTDTNIVAGQNINETAASTVNVKSASAINHSTGTHSTKAGDIFRDAYIRDNTGGSASAAQAAKPSRTVQIDYNDNQINTVVSRMPTHEPFKGHPKSSNTEPPRGDFAVESSTYTGSGPKAIGDPSKLTSVTPTKTQRVGSGASKAVEYDKTKMAEKIKVGTRNVPKNVEAAIAKGSSVTGVDYGFMMAMAEKESSFNPNAKAGTSSASGLYQFTDGTWNATVSKYGAAHGITKEDRFDPESQAIMAGYLAKENKKIIENRTGQPASNTDLYMGHFLGGNGAAKLLTANGNERADMVAGSAAANANRNIFYAKDGTPRSVDEVKQSFANYIEPRSVAYAANKPNATT